MVVSKGDRLDQEELISGLASMGYRREYQVEHRGEMAVRGSIVDVFGSTADVPVRIDLWGDEVDRLSRVLRGGPALDRRCGHRRAVRLPGDPPHRGGPRAGPVAGGGGALGPPAVGEAGRRPGLRRHGVVAAVADRGRAPARRSAARQLARPAGRAPAHAGPGVGAARRGGRPGRHPGPDVGCRRRGLPPPPPALRPPARPHRSRGVDRDRGPGGPRHRGSGGHGMGPGGRRRREAARPDPATPVGRLQGDRVRRGAW